MQNQLLVSLTEIKESLSTIFRQMPPPSAEDEQILRRINRPQILTDVFFSFLNSPEFKQMDDEEQSDCLSALQYYYIEAWARM